MLENHVKKLLKGLGHDIKREGLKDTPKRVVKFLREFCTRPDFDFTTFDSEGYDEMIIVEPIRFGCLCEHHLLPFFGTAYIGYIPREKIAGLSKLPRMVAYHSASLNNQERLTKQIAEGLTKHLDPLGLGVILKAEHTCMSIRGAKQPGAVTTTSCLKGRFKIDPATRSEFLSSVKA